MTETLKPVCPSLRYSKTSTPKSLPHTKSKRRVVSFGLSIVVGEIANVCANTTGLDSRQLTKRYLGRAGKVLRDGDTDATSSCPLRTARE